MKDNKISPVGAILEVVVGRLIERWEALIRRCNLRP